MPRPVLLAPCVTRAEIFRKIFALVTELWPMSKADQKQPKRDEVLKYIQANLPEDASLMDVVESLCELRLKTMGPYDREWLDEIGDEVQVEVRLMGDRLPAVPTRADVAAMLLAPDNKRDALILRILYSTGIRIGELAVLTFADIRYSECSIFVRSGKGDKDRYALGDAHTFELVAEYQGKQKPAARLFTITRRQIQRVFEKWGKVTGLNKKYEAMGRNLSPHSFRHAFATHCYENGMDLFTLKRLLGHDFLDTTQRYIDVGMGKWRPDYLKYHELARLP